MTNLRHVTAIGIFGAIGLILTGCGGGGGGNDGPADAGGPPAASAALTRAADCDELLTAFRTDARAKIAVQARELRAGGWLSSGGGAPTPVGVPTPAGLPTSPPQGGRPPDATDTNTQVPGVDEADLVEIDGGRIYLIRGNEVVVLQATPPDALSVADRIPIEGAPLGMFVTSGRALVLSLVYDDDRLGGDTRCAGIGAPFPPYSGLEGSWLVGLLGLCQPFFTKLTLLDVTATPARTTREAYVEGSYVAARRHGTRARVIVRRDWGAPPTVLDPWGVLSTGPPLRSEAEFVARVDQWEAGTLAAIDASTLDDWVPALRERVGDTLAARALSCADAYVPPATLARQGTSLIVGLALDSDDAPLDDALLVGDTSEVYANADTLVLAHPAWQDEPVGDASLRTALHVFALAPDATGVTYRGSGFVPGSLLSQFALDVHDDVVRVATSFVSELTGQTATRITTARVEDETLVTLGATENLAPGEQLRGARFLGDRAYLVTFVQVDPLFVIDLSDPAHPRTLGEATLPGFSEYLHPLDAGHLLTIGRAATSEGQSLGVALRIFDVTVPTAPALSAEYVLPLNGSSPAETDHLAFTFEPRLGLLALPFNQWEVNYNHGTLRLFEVGAETGIRPRGVVDHGSAGTTAPCAPPYDWESCFVSEWMERGLFIDDVIYSISTSTVQVHGLDDLATPLAKVSLP